MLIAPCACTCAVVSLDDHGGNEAPSPPTGLALDPHYDSTDAQTRLSGLGTLHGDLWKTSGLTACQKRRTTTCCCLSRTKLDEQATLFVLIMKRSAMEGATTSRWTENCERMILIYMHIMGPRALRSGCLGTLAYGAAAQPLGHLPLAQFPLLLLLRLNIKTTAVQPLLSPPHMLCVLALLSANFRFLS